MSHFLVMAFLESEVQNLAQSSTSEPCLVFVEWPSDPEEAPAHNRTGVFNWARAEQVYESKHALRQKMGTNMVCCALQCRCGGGRDDSITGVCGGCVRRSHSDSSNSLASNPCLMTNSQQSRQRIHVTTIANCRSSVPCYYSASEFELE